MLPTDAASTRRVTLAQVETACRSLPDPVWHRIMSDHPAPRRAATLVPVLDVDGEAAVVVTQRAGTMDHGGDWVFPGGGVADDDRSHLDAARREAAEELGLEPTQLTVIGQLATRGPIVSGFVIETYVGVIEADSVLAPDRREVADVAVVLLGDLLADGAHHRGPARVARYIDAALLERFSDRPDLSNLRHYRIRDDEYLWGLQADILHELLAHLTDGRHDF